jgi:hypothetical protein
MIAFSVRSSRNLVCDKRSRQWSEFRWRDFFVEVISSAFAKTEQLSV